MWQQAGPVLAQSKDSYKVERVGKCVTYWLLWRRQHADWLAAWRVAAISLCVAGCVNV
jgi:hypothetical protein